MPPYKRLPIDRDDFIRRNAGYPVARAMSLERSDIGRRDKSEERVASRPSTPPFQSFIKYTAEY